MRLDNTKIKSLICLSMILLLFIPKILSANKQLPVESQMLWEREFIYIAPSDINHDSIDELITIINDFAIQPFDQNLYSLIASMHLDRGTFKSLFSMCGGLDEKIMWATFNRNDSLFLYDIWQRREIFITQGRDIAKPKGWDGHAEQIELKDINSDGRIEVIVNVIVGWDLKPRGIFVIDWETGILRWKFLCGPNITSIKLVDIDNDSNTEILFGTTSPGNGNSDNGTEDIYTYVFMLRCDNTLQWIRPIGHYSSATKVDWFKSSIKDSLRVIVVEQGCPAGNRKCDNVFLLDALTGDIVKKVQCSGFNNGFSLVNDNKKHTYIVIGGSDDTLRMFDENLKLIRKRNTNGGGIRLINSGYFIDRKEKNIAIYTNRGLLCLYDLNLRLLSTTQTSEIYNFFPIKYNNHLRLLINLEKNSKTIWQLYEFNKIPFLSRRIAIMYVLSGFVFLLLLFTVGMVYARYTKTRDIRTVIRGLTGKSGVIEINQKGEVITISPRAREILKIEDKDIKQTIKQLSAIKQIHPIIELAKSMLSDTKLSSPQEIAISLSQEQSYLVRCIRVKKGVLITFEDISAVEYMKRITSWAPVAQKLAHGIKTPLMNIQLSAQQLESACEPVKNKTDKIIDGIKSEAKRLRKLTDNFMRFTQFSPLNLVSENINDILNDLCSKYSFSISQQIKIECNLTNDLPKVMVDRKEIETAISIIIENAVEAVVSNDGEKQGVLNIKTSISEKQDKEKIKKFIAIEVSDTGKGIPEKYKSELFKPYFTYGKPEGTGLGLTLAKKIIESHNGSIEIQSKEGVGTQVNIYLPV